METKSKYIMLLYGFIEADYRVIREINTLKDQNLDLRLINITYPGEPKPNLHSCKISPIMKMEKEKRTNPIMLLKFWILTSIFLLTHAKDVKIVHAHDLTALVPGVIMKIVNPHINLVYDSHELFPEAALEKVNKISYSLFYLIEYISLNFIDHLITVTPIQLQLLRKRAERNIPGINLYNFPSKTHPLPTKEDNVEDKNLVENFVFGISGSIVDQRGYIELIEACEELVEEGYNFNLHIIGDGPLAPKLIETINYLGIQDRVIYHGFVPREKAMDIMRKLDFGIGLYEGLNANLSFSNKLLEYTSIQLPFIFSDLYGSKFVLEKLGVPIVDRINPHIIKQKIIEMVNRDKQFFKSYRENSKNYFLNQWNWEREKEKFIQLIQNINENARKKENSLLIIS